MSIDRLAMNPWFVAAGLLLLLVGLVHSVLGELLIFRRMRMRTGNGFIPTHGAALLRERHVRILWASWHLGTALGSGMVAMLFWLALPSSHAIAASPIPLAIIVALLASSALVLVGTQGRHPGWVGLLGVAVLVLRGVGL